MAVATAVSRNFQEISIEFRVNSVISVQCRALQCVDSLIGTVKWNASLEQSQVYRCFGRVGELGQRGVATALPPKFVLFGHCSTSSLNSNVSTFIAESSSSCPRLSWWVDLVQLNV